MDERVAALVEIINSFPGVETFSSCGGHEEKFRFSQCDPNDFIIKFDLDPDDDGFYSLGILTMAAVKMNKNNDGMIMITAIINPFMGEGSPDDLAFMIMATNGSDPDEYAETIKSCNI